MSVAESKTEIFNVAPGGEGGGQSRGSYERYVQPFLAELVGSALFIFVGCAAVISDPGTTGSLQPALAHGLALSAAVAAFGEISGGHFNPAVSVCAYLLGGMELALLAPYVLAQMIGGMIGAGLAKGVFPEQLFNQTGGAAFKLSDTATLGSVTVAEIIMTLSLTMVISLGAINGRTRSHLAPFCIGLTVAANILAGGSVSGACMNPARAFGPAVAAGHWTHHWVYWVGPLAGALLTVSLVRLLMGDKKTRLVFK
ncbi:aquaporin-8a.1 [Denticeps clupeoides]|uniref:aquaporin-8a.1 n=1 Tax=Denticeps clupeoides TaxID=299321 RepID=UPI0010A2FB94|nr:aquaporin-8-like [Denticeps clupeoides]